MRITSPINNFKASTQVYRIVSLSLGSWLRRPHCANHACATGLVLSRRIHMPGLTVGVTSMVQIIYRLTSAADVLYLSWRRFVKIETLILVIECSLSDFNGTNTFDIYCSGILIQKTLKVD